MRLCTNKWVASSLTISHNIFICILVIGNESEVYQQHCSHAWQGGKENENPFRINCPWRRSYETISASHGFGFSGVGGADVNLLVNGMIRGPHCHCWGFVRRTWPYWWAERRDCILINIMNLKRCKAIQFPVTPTLRSFPRKAPRKSGIWIGAIFGNEGIHINDKAIDFVASWKLKSIHVIHSLRVLLLHFITISTTIIRTRRCWRRWW